MGAPVKQGERRRLADILCGDGRMSAEGGQRLGGLADDEVGTHALGLRLQADARDLLQSSRRQLHIAESSAGLAKMRAKLIFFACPLPGELGRGLLVGKPPFHNLCT